MNEDDDRFPDGRYMPRERDRFGSYWDDRRDRDYDRDYARDYAPVLYTPGRYAPSEYPGRERIPRAPWEERPSYRGKGPASYTRSDERIRELVCEALTDDPDVDATDIEVTVKDGEVILSGTALDRRQKRLAEDCSEQIWGVKDVQNQIRIATADQQGKPASSTEGEAKPNRA